ncbi:ATP-binding cassette domain-containing protein [Eubacteriales bacterium OttesenSCG-928-A19]|nr:ATP-binding cassette domain-containing protein [Eubacteriales bacterium OttesenSCG-928-A19]
MWALEVKNLAKLYRNGVRALDGLSFRMDCGKIFSLLGPNGAGKSTLINILTTYYKPTSGEVLMLGKDLFKNPAWAREQIACVAQQVSIDTHLSLMENMLFQSRLYKVEQHEAKKRIARLVDSFDLVDYLKYPTSSYSGGVKRRLDIAMNMVSLPKILFLDEPTVGMDVGSRKAMWDMLSTIREEFGTSIFLTTHYLEEADALSDSICVMKKGRALAQGTPLELRGIVGQNMLRVTFESKAQAKEQYGALLGKLPAQSLLVRDKGILVVVEDSEETIAPICRCLIDLAVPFMGIEVVQPSLEDVFLTLTGKGDKIA